MKRILSGSLFVLIGIVSMVFMAPRVSAAGEVRLYIAPGSLNQTTGAQFDVAVRVGKTSADKVDYARVGLVYSVSKLEVVSVSGVQTAFNKNSTWLSNINNSAGVVYVSGESDALATPADVLVATVKFRSKAAGRADLSFTGDSAVGDMFGPGKVRNYLTSTSGSVVSINDAAVPGPTLPTSRSSSPTPAPTPEEVSTPDTPTSNEDSAGDTVNGIQPTAGGGDSSAEADSDDGSTPGIITRYGWIAGIASVIVGLATTMIVKLVRMHKAGDTDPSGLGEMTVSPMGVISSDIEPESIEKEWPLLGATTLEENPADDYQELASASDLPAEPEPLELSPVPDQIAGLERISSDSPDAQLATPQVAVETFSQSQQVNSGAYTPEPNAAAETVSSVSPTPVIAPTFEPVVSAPTAPLNPVAVQDVSSTTPTMADDDIPDMFEVGEVRLRQEGYVSHIPPRPQA